MEYNKKIVILAISIIAIAVLWSLIASGIGLQSWFNSWGERSLTKQQSGERDDKKNLSAAQNGSQLQAGITQPYVKQAFKLYGVLGEVDGARKMFKLKISNPYPTDDRTLDFWMHYNEELQIYNAVYNMKAGLIDTVSLSQPQKDIGLLKNGARARVIGEWSVIPGENRAVFLALKVAIDDFEQK